MKARYPQLATGPGAPALPPDRSRRTASRRAARDEPVKEPTTGGTADPGDLADVFAELREVWPN
jgi:hypothetical protein